MPVILLYGIYGGVTTPTEAAAVAAALRLHPRRRASTGRSRSRALYAIMADSVRSSAAVGLVIGGALIFNYIVASENIPGQVAGALVGLRGEPAWSFSWP